MKDKRSFYRHPMQYPIEIFDEPNDPIGRFHTTDVSFGGISFSMERFFDLKSFVRVHIPVGQRIFRIRGQIAYSVKITKTKLYQTGVAYLDASDQFMAKMAEEIISLETFRLKLTVKRHHEVSEEEAASLWIQKNASRFARNFKK